MNKVKNLEAREIAQDIIVAILAALALLGPIAVLTWYMFTL